MSTKNVAIRISAEGSAEVRRELGSVKQSLVDVGEAGERSINQGTAAIDRQMERWKKLAAQAREAESQQAKQAHFNSILGVGAGGGKSAQDSAAAFEALLGASGPSRQMVASRINLARQGADVFTMAAMGSSPGMIAVSQGPQVIDAWVTAGLKVAPAMAAAGAAVVAFGGAAIGAAVAIDKNERALAKLDVAARGLGAASGLSGAALDSIAQQAAKTSDVTISAARDMAAGYVQTGRIGGSVLGDLIRLTSDYAATTGEDAKAATQELAKAFADPAKGAADLNAKLNFLSASERQHIENLARAGDAAGAQAIMVDKLKASLLSAADATSGWGHLLQGLKRDADNWFTQLGINIDKLVTGGDDATKLARLRTQRARLGDFATVDPSIRYQREQADKEIAALEARATAAAARAKTAAANQASEDRQALLDRYNPNAAKLRELTADRDRALKLGAGDAAAVATVKSLNAEINAVSKGYASAADMASKLHQVESKAATAARKAAQEAEEADRKRLAAIKQRIEYQERLNAVEFGNRQAIAGILGEDSQGLKLEARRRELTRSYEESGLGMADAARRVEDQLRREALAQAEADRRAALARQIQGAELGKVPSVVPQDIELMNAKVAAATQGLYQFRYAGEAAFDRIGQLVRDGTTAWKDWKSAGVAAVRDLLAEFVQLAALNPLKNMLFGADQYGRMLPTLGGGFLGKLFGSAIGANADGTDNWRGGLTWVGERGRELVNLPRGAQVIPNHRLGGLGGGAVVNIAIDARGAGPREVELLGGELQALRRDLPGIITGTVQDGINRRQIQAA